MEIFIIVTLVLAVVTLVGHGLWVLCAWVFRGCQPRQEDTPRILCRNCGTSTRGYPCLLCGYSPGNSNDVHIASKVLARLANAGVLDPAVQRQVDQAIAAEASGRVPTARLAPVAAHPAILTSSSRADAASQPTPAMPEAMLADGTPADDEDEEGVLLVDALPMATSADMPPVVPHWPRPAVAADRNAPLGERAKPGPVPRIPAKLALPPVPPRKPVGEMLKRFLERSNIRWGELIGGLLIVGCSAALVVSLWAQISQQPLLKVGVFTSVVAGLFGLGLYADKKWKLPSTSMAILVTAVLLVPLHYCAMVVIGGDQYAQPLALAVEAVAGGLLAWLTYLAAGTVCNSSRRMLALGLTILSLMGPVLYVAGAWHDSQNLLRVMLTGGVIITAYLVVGGLAVARLAKSEPWNEQRLRDAVCLCGCLLFAAVPSLVMHAYFGNAATGYWKAMTPLFALVTLPTLMATGVLLARAGGARFWQKTLRIAEMAASVLPLIWIGVAYPMPVSVVVSAVVVAGVLGITGWTWRRSHAMALAMFCLMVAYLVAVPAMLGRVAWTDASGQLLAAIFVPRLGMEVVPGMLLLLAAGWYVRARDPLGGSAGLAIGGGVGLLGLLHLLWQVYVAGVVVPGAWVLLAVYGAACLAAGLVAQMRPLAGCGTALLVLGGERLSGGGSHAWLGSAVLMATWWSTAGLVNRKWVAYAKDNAAWTLGLGVAMLLWRLPVAKLGISAATGWWVVAVAGALLWMCRSPGYLANMQIALSGAVVLQLLALGHRAGGDWQDATLWVTAGIGLVVLQLAWSLARLGWPRETTGLLDVPSGLGEIRGLVHTPLTADRVIGGMATLGLLACMGMGLWELAQFELNATSPSFAATTMTTDLFTGHYQGAWVAMVAIVAVAAVEVAVNNQSAWAVLAVLGVYMLGAVVAVRTMPTMGASLIRFSVTGLFVLLSVPLLLPAKALPWRRDFGEHESSIRATVIAIGTSVIVLLTVLAAVANVSGIGPRLPAAGSLLAGVPAFGNYVVPMMVVALLLAGYAVRQRSNAMAMLSSGVVLITVTLAYVLQVGPQAFALVELLQVNAVAAGGCAWVWLLVRQLGQVEAQAPRGVHLLAGLPALVAVGLAVWVQVAMWFFGGSCGWIGQYAGSPLAGVEAIMAGGLAYALWRRKLGVGGLGVAMVVLGSLLAAVADQMGIAAWCGFHVLLACHAAGAWALYEMSRAFAMRGWLGEVNQTWMSPRAEELDADGRVRLGYVTQASEERADVRESRVAGVLHAARRWGTMLVVAGVLFALRAVLNDPQRPWWTIGALLLFAGLGVRVAQRELRPGYLYPAAVLMNLSVTFLWASQYWTPSAGRVRDLVMVNVLALAGAGLGALVLDVQVFAKGLGASRPRGMHGVAAVVTVAVLLGVSVMQLASGTAWAGSADAMLVSGSAAVATLALAVACLWDTRLKTTPWLVYLGTFAMLGMTVDLANLSGRELIQISVISVIGMVIVWGMALRRSGEMDQWLERMGAARLQVEGLPVANAWVGVTALAVLLGHEAILAANYGRAEMGLWLIVVVSVLLLVMAAMLLAVAMQRIRDPLGLPMRHREGYVYAAQGVLLLLGVHIRLTCPELFGGFFLQYWPAVVMVLAFVLTGVGELLKRRGLRIIGGPISNTAWVLPLLPALAFPALPTQMGYSLTLLMVAGFYGASAGYRRSSISGVLMLVSLNGAFWSLLWQSQTLGITRHPQLWLIPPAMSVIAISYFAKSRLDARQRTAMRYGAMLVAYAASLGDVLLIGMINAPWLAGILGLISVAGAVAGIFLRIRSFLYTGTVFLLISLGLLIYHASVNLEQTWLMWLAGIALGVSILLAFAMFEKHKNRVMKVIDDLNTWEG